MDPTSQAHTQGTSDQEGGRDRVPGTPNILEANGKAHEGETNKLIYSCYYSRRGEKERERGAWLRENETKLNELENRKNRNENKYKLVWKVKGLVQKGGREREDAIDWDDEEQCNWKWKSLLMAMVMIIRAGGWSRNYDNHRQSLTQQEYSVQLLQWDDWTQSLSYLCAWPSFSLYLSLVLPSPDIPLPSVSKFKTNSIWQFQVNITGWVWKFGESSPHLTSVSLCLTDCSFACTLCAVPVSLCAFHQICQPCLGMNFLSR